MVVAVVLQRLVDPVGEPEQSQFPQRAEVADAEVVGQGRIDLLSAVDVAVGHPSAQSLGRHVDEFDLVGRAHDLVGDGFLLDDSGDRLDGVVE